MTYKTKLGAELKGSLSDIIQVVKALGEIIDITQLGGDIPAGYYYSESKHELVEIATMQPNHAWNAFLKLFESTLDGLKKDRRTIATRVKAFTEFGSNKTAQALLARSSQT